MRNTYAQRCVPYTGSHMYVCGGTCICIYIYIFTYVHIYIYVHIHAQIAVHNIQHPIQEHNILPL